MTTEPPTPTLRERADILLIEGERRCDKAVAERSLTSSELDEFQKGMWRIALVIDPENNVARPDQDFLNKAFASNPHFTGWPIWLDPRGFKDRKSAPLIIEKAWQALIISLDDNWSPHVDFMRLDPKGKFFLQRIMQDDLTDKVQPVLRPGYETTRCDLFRRPRVALRCLPWQGKAVPLGPDPAFCIDAGRRATSYCNARRSR